ncbi:MAG: HAD family phosphatase [Pseudomonadota bacterium]
MRVSDYEAIIFDSDGVLVDSEVIHVAVERELLSEIGLNYSHETYMARFVGLSNADYRTALGADYARLVGGTVPSDFDTRLDERVWPRIQAELKPLDGVIALVQSFHGKVAVGSSAPFDRLSEKLKLTKLAELFEPHIYSVDHVSRGKPNPDLFLHAARQLGVLPAQCIVVEDSIHGIAAALAAGMKLIGFAGSGHADQGLPERLLSAGASIVVKSHSEIRNLI